MSRRSMQLMMGLALLAILAAHAPFVVVPGLLYTWWCVHRSAHGVAPDAAAATAMIGGFVGRMGLTLLLFAAIPMVSAWEGLELAGLLFTRAARLTGITVLSTGLMALVQAFMLGLSVRLLAPSLPG